MQRAAQTAFTELALVGWVTGESVSRANALPSPADLEADAERTMVLQMTSTAVVGGCDTSDKLHGTPQPLV